MAILLPALLLAADVDTRFHNAPASAQAAKNPYAGDEEAAQAGQKLYVRNCLSCHGKTGNGTGKVPSLVDGRLDSVAPGEVFWFITRGDKENGMPAWGSLPAKQRWQIVTYVKSMGTPQGTSQATREANVSPPADTNTSKLHVYSYGIRNAGGGIAVNPQTGELWCSVNERDGLGDNLVPDYITHVQEGGFYGWPWWYMGGHQDPRHQGIRS